MLFRRLKTWIAAAAFAVCVIAPAAAQIPDPFARELARTLARLDQVQNQNAFSRAAGPFGGGLAEGQGQRFTLSLRAGQSYRIVGICDARCGDMDLRLFDPNGALITQDIAPNAAPMINVNPALTGAYTVEASIAQCGAAHCYFAFNVYAR
jgi:hypothetical protein